MNIRNKLNQKLKMGLWVVQGGGSAKSTLFALFKAFWVAVLWGFVKKGRKPFLERAGQIDPF